jgi:hypothetical protein
VAWQIGPLTLDAPSLGRSRRGEDCKVVDGASLSQWQVGLPPASLVPVGRNSARFHHAGTTNV